MNIQIHVYWKLKSIQQNTICHYIFRFIIAFLIRPTCTKIVSFIMFVLKTLFPKPEFQVLMKGSIVHVQCTSIYLSQYPRSILHAGTAGICIYILFLSTMIIPPQSLKERPVQLQHKHKGLHVIFTRTKYSDRLTASKFPYQPTYWYCLYVKKWIVTAWPSSMYSFQV